MIDVGQGDSFFIKLKNKTILIDTGGSLFTSGNISKRTVLPYLKSEGIKSLDYLILTHGDADHMGEAYDIVSNFKVNNVIMNSGNNNDVEVNLIDLLSSKSIKYSNISEGVIVIDGISFNFLNKKNDDENGDSLITKFTINGYNLLFMGDSGVKNEEYILSKYNLYDIDILKVGHHGSKTSSGAYFINSIKPVLSLISVGKGNMYNHPNNDVIDRLKSVDSIIGRTDLSGAIKVKFGEKLRILPIKKGN